MNNKRKMKKKENRCSSPRTHTVGPHLHVYLKQRNPRKPIVD
jgi:hypothetical protein